MSLPTPDAYWVTLPAVSRPGRLLAGEYPGAKEADAADEKIGRFLAAGVTFFLDLTEAGEYNLRPYAAIAQSLAAAQNRPLTYRRMPIPDLGTPSPADMARILAVIDEALTAGETVYVHCFGGIGRTGTVIGCWLVTQGLTGEEALAQIAAWRQRTPDGWKTSPETDRQRQMVLSWR